MMKIWYFNIPLKIKCFVWLTCNKKINTWDNLSKKGWIGPNRCSLCNKEAESVDHLFVSCHFLKEVICGLNCIFDVNILWNAPTFLENLSIWVSNKGSLLYLPLFLMWNIWKARNHLCFDDQKPIMTSLLHIIFEEVNTFKPLLKHMPKIRNIGKSPTSVFPMIFFDGAAANNNR